MSRHLAFEISDSLLRAKILNSGVPEFSFAASLETRIPEERKQILQDLLRKELDGKPEVDTISIGVITPQSTLVPSSVFTETKPDAIYKLCFGEIAEERTADYNRIAEHAIVNVYELSDWVKSFFVLKFPRIVVQHSGTHLIRYALDQNTFRTKVTIELFRDHFHLNIVKHGKLEYYSHFNHTGSEDVIYHLLFVLQQKELTMDQGSIMIGSGHDEQLANAVLTGLNKISDLSNYSKSVEHDLHFKAQLLCV